MSTVEATPQLRTWSAPDLPFTIEYDPSVLEEIGRDAAGGLRAPLGPVEVGGLLIGSFARRRLRILGFEPIPCEYASGPFFELSGNDHRALAGRLNSLRDAGSEVVGWYRSRLGGETRFTKPELDLHEQYFHKPWQVLLLQCADASGNFDSRFLVREFDEPASRALDSPRSADEKTKRTRILAAWGVVAAMVLLSVATLLYLRSYLRPASAGSPVRVLHLEAVKRNRIVELSWDREPVGEARQGQMEIRDGALRKQLQLDRNSLAAGRLWYEQTSDVSTFVLTVERKDGAVLEGSTTVVAPLHEADVAREKAPKSATSEPASKPEPNTAPVEPAPPQKPVEAIDSTIKLQALPSLAGSWALQTRGRSRSQARVKSLTITITGNDSSLRGRLEAECYAKRGMERIHFSFAGKSGEGSTHLYWTAENGRRGEITFTPVANAADIVEVVWQRPGSDTVFQETLQRAK